MQLRTFWPGVTAILFLVAPVRGQMPSETLKKTTQEAWYKAVQHAINVERNKQRFNIPVSPLFEAADRAVVLDVGPPEAPRLTYDKATTTLTWNLTRRPGVAAPQAAIDKAVRDFLVNVAGQNLPPLVEQKDVGPDGALKTRVVLAAAPRTEVLELMKRVAALEAEMKKLEDLRRELRKLDAIRGQLRELSEKVEEMRRRISGVSGGRTPSALITPGAVSWYNPWQLWAYHCYPSVGYSYVPAYYALWTPRTPVADAAARARLRRQLDMLSGALATVTREVDGIYEVAFGKEAAAREPVPDLRGLGPRDAEKLFARGAAFYWDGEHAEALALFRKAVALRELDARYWSFKALAERALGERVAAVASARKAAGLRKLDLPGPDVFGVSMERVQGAERRFLNAF